jgi:putative flippase GtrA
MSNKDLALILVIGAAVGLLVQPVLANVGVLVYLGARFGLSTMTLRVIAWLIFVVGAPSALFIASFIGRRMAGIYQFAKFAAVGVLNSSIDLGIFNLLTLALGTPLVETSTGRYTFFAYKTISFFAATTNSYFWNRTWTFKTDQSGAGTAAKFYALTALTWALNAGVATTVATLGSGNTLWTNLIGPVAGILSAMFANFFGYKLLVFKDRSPS